MAKSKDKQAAKAVNIALADLHMAARVAAAIDGGFRRGIIVDIGKSSCIFRPDGRTNVQEVSISAEDVGNVIVGFLKDASRSIKKFPSIAKAIGKSVAGKNSENSAENSENSENAGEKVSPRETGYRRKLEAAELSVKPKKRRKEILEILGKKDGQNLSALQQKLLDEYLASE